MSFKWEDGELLNSLSTFNARMDRGITAATAYHASRATAYARDNAPWTDRTSNARNGLFSTAERDFPIYRIIVAHSVPYGIWLETRWSGKFQIIRPTVAHEGPELMATVAALFSRLKGI